jgi:hypothetical protein
MLMFGIQLKGFIIGILVAYFVIPFIQRSLSSRSTVPSN